MFNSIKNFVVEILVVAGILTAPVSVPVQEVATPTPPEITSEQNIDTSSTSAETNTTEDKSNEQKETVQLESISRQPATNYETPSPEKEESQQPKPTEEITARESLDKNEERPQRQNGQCGTASGEVVNQVPTENLCRHGQASEIERDGDKFTWRCLGIADGNDSFTCRAYIEADAQCGVLANTAVPDNYRKNELCSVGSAINIDIDGNQMSWTCNGKYRGEETTCRAIKAISDEDLEDLRRVPEPKINGQCGYAARTSHLEKPTSRLCEAGTPSSVYEDTQDNEYRWTCYGENDGSQDRCEARKEVVNTERLEEAYPCMIRSGLVMIPTCN